MCVLRNSQASFSDYSCRFYLPRYFVQTTFLGFFDDPLKYDRYLLLSLSLIKRMTFDTCIAQNFQNTFSSLSDELSTNHIMRLPGLEPGTSTLSVSRSNQLSYNRRWRLGGSNSWPSECKSDALPTELNPQVQLTWKTSIQQCKESGAKRACLNHKKHPKMPFVRP